MNELLGMLQKQLNVNEAQAKGGLGSLLQMAQSAMGSDFSKIASAIPQSDVAMQAAPKIESSGLSGLMSSALSALGQGDSKVAMINQVVSQFGSLGLDTNTILKFAPIVIDFVKSKADGTTSESLQKVFSQFKF